jgi:hypothetical protein
MRKTAYFLAFLFIITVMVVGCDSTTTSTSAPQEVPGADAPSAVTKNGSKLSLKKKKDPGLGATPPIIPKTRANL